VLPDGNAADGEVVEQPDNRSADRGDDEAGGPLSDETISSGPRRGAGVVELSDLRDV
jgi:hypothetical protein